ncbi:MAG: hypothetical protein C0467_32645 [Planctomycetaceae bacterium]|nr:hypothetical protein [Planctomycetaceae bacterium]
MEVNVAKEVAAMQRMTAKQLRTKYAEVFGDGTNANNRTWLIRRIAWRLQCRAEGNLSERARVRATELACDADLRLKPTARTTHPHNSPVRNSRSGSGCHVSGHAGLQAKRQRGVDPRAAGLGHTGWVPEHGISVSVSTDQALTQ